jgi:hypothetical protein
MNAVQALIVVAIRLWCASSMIRGVVSFPSAFLYTDQLSDQTATIYMIVTSTVWFGVGVAGWFTAPSLVKNLIKTPTAQTVTLKVDPETIILSGCFLIGWFYLVRYLPELISHLAIFVLEKEAVTASVPYGGAEKSFSYSDWEPIIKSMLIITVAFWMAFRPQHIAKLFAYIRNAGVWAKKPVDS